MELYQTIKGGLKGVITGLVTEVEKHPNADKLSKTKVDVGQGQILSIVCGAPNVKAGQKVLVATVGTTLYPKGGGSLEIKKSKIRGEISEGMICAEDEIGTGKSHDGIMVLPENTEIGKPASLHFGLREETVLEIGLTPNRVDAASHIGTARDLSAVIQTRLGINTGLTMPDVSTFKTGSQPCPIRVEVVNADKCPRYSGIHLTGIKVGESPGWLLQRLQSIGVKPINNVVDITNFVLHETGQPLHAFDAQKINGGKVVIRTLNAGTEFETLDGLKRKLHAEDLMICDANDGMCIAGVFGGSKTGITETTEEIFLESAYFSPSGIRKTSKIHNLKTDAAFRYERGADPGITMFALMRASLLLQKIAGARLESAPVDIKGKEMVPHKINYNPSIFTAMAGVSINPETSNEILTRLGFTISSNQTGLVAEVPGNKPDVTRDVDLCEEVLRIFGFDRIPESKDLKSSLPNAGAWFNENFKSKVLNYLADQSFHEIITHSMVSSKESPKGIKLENPLSKEMEMMRDSMIPSGLKTIAYNLNRKSADLKLFELGKTYSQGSGSSKEKNLLAIFACGNKTMDYWAGKPGKFDFYGMKGWVEGLLAKAGIRNFEFLPAEIADLENVLHILVKNRVIGHVGTISTSATQSQDVTIPVFYAELNWDELMNEAKRASIKIKDTPRFPEVRRDLSMILDSEVKYSELERISLASEKKWLKKVLLFDSFEGGKIPSGKKSYAVAFWLYDEDKTLTEAEIEKAMEKISSALEREIKAEIRKS